MPVRLAPVALAVLFSRVNRSPSLATHLAPPPSPWIMVNWPQYGGTSARSLLLMRRSWRCLADGVPDCAAAATLLDIVTEAKRYQGKAQIAHINRAVNLLIRPTPGGWVGALEVLTFADGDCKDYSIAKFFALHEAGVPPERVRLVIVRNHKRSEDHMVVAVYDEDAWFILDSATMILATDTEDAAHYTPLFVLDKAGVGRYWH